MKLRTLQRISRGDEGPGPIKGRAPLAATLMLGAFLLSCKEPPPPPPPEPQPAPVQKVQGSNGKAPYYRIFTEPRPLERSPSKAQARPAAKAPVSSSVTPSREPQEQPMGELASLPDLRAAGFAAAADSIRSRMEQEQPKMRLSRQQADKIVSYFQEHMPSMPKTRELHSRMPRSTVELVRAVGERGVPAEEAERISGFLVYFTDHMRFRNLKQLDVNTSHVIGRQWKEIDFSGEGTNWRWQKNHWGEHGVRDFQHAADVCRYFRAASKYRFFKRIYKARSGLPQDMDERCR